MKYPFRSIEKKWSTVWQKQKIYEPNLKNAKRPFYNLMMFPYPSAEGLHVGNMYAFVGSDIYGRFLRMRGSEVFEPIGLDGFGIHSENYALKIGAHPMKLASKTEKRFYEQLSLIGNGFAWNERLETYDPEYYKWTQWLFLQMWKRGLAYRKKAAVNWCPSCKTVLADEQVIAGKCERCSAEAVKKDLEQWFFKITAYAEKLLQNLEKLDWSEKVKIAQRNWIGKSEGAIIKFKIKNSELTLEKAVEIFTTRPDTLFGATYLAVSPELAKKWLDAGWQASGAVKIYVNNALLKNETERIAEGKEKTGVDSEIFAVNPANQKEIPVWITDYVLGNVGTGAVMAVPAHDQRDFEFAEKFNLPAIMVICPHYPETTCPILDKAYVGEGHLVASEKFNGMKSENAKDAVTNFVGGKKTVNYRLRDWLISRQRYWGPPIPMIYCDRCGFVAVSEKDLPVKLPYVKNFRPKGMGKSPLADTPKFYKTKCPQCEKPARRETDVSDTFLDSAWYHIGYLMKSGNWKLGFGNSVLFSLMRRWLPVDMYIGGAEHSVLHLLYTRFLTMVLNEIGLIDFDEPFAKFRAHGLLIKDGAKMSKSKGNVINPDMYIKKYGADVFRMYLMFLGPFAVGGDFRDSGIVGIVRFLDRVWNFAGEKLKVKNLKSSDDLSLKKKIHQTVKKITEDIEALRYNTAISALMILLNDFEAKKDAVSLADFKIFLRLIAPFAPFVSEELWQKFFTKSRKLKATSRHSIHISEWPEYDKKYIFADTFTLIVQINGKVRDQFEVISSITEREAKNLVLNREKVKSWILDKQIKKVIFVSNKLINFVV